MDDSKPPIEPGPEPDTTDAAEPYDADPDAESDTTPTSEDASHVIDGGDDHVDEMHL